MDGVDLGQPLFHGLSQVAAQIFDFRNFVAHKDEDDSQLLVSGKDLSLPGHFLEPPCFPNASLDSISIHRPRPLSLSYADGQLNGNRPGERCPTGAHEQRKGLGGCPVLKQLADNPPGFEAVISVELQGGREAFQPVTFEGGTVRWPWSWTELAG